VADSETFKKAWGIDEIAAGARDLGDESNPDLGAFPPHALDELEDDFWLAVERVRRGLNREGKEATQMVAINPRTFEQIELDLETARGQLAAGHIDPTIDDDTKMLAAAIAQAGAEIALALYQQAEQSSN
jgi:hypothetical protein